MKRLFLAAIAAAFGLALFSCGESMEALEAEPGGSLTLSSTEAAGMHITIGTTTYTGLAGGGGACNDDTSFTGLGCTQLSASGTTVATDLCLGTWNFEGIVIYDVSDTTCIGSPIAVCGDVVDFAVVLGSNVVSVVCNIEGADVTFDVSFQ